MHQRRQFVADLEPDRVPVPFTAILNAWRRAEFQPEACARSLEKLIKKYNIPREFFCAEELIRGGLPATRELLYGFYQKKRKWRWTLSHKGKRLNCSLSRQAIPTIGNLIRLMRQVHGVDELRERLDTDVDGLIEFLSVGFKETAFYGFWPRINQPGIYRREHASIVVRSRDTTLITDPQSAQTGWTTNQEKYPLDEEPLNPDAVLITHGHNDHWHLPSILSYAEGQMPVIVPRVRKRSLLSPEDMADSLRLVRQTHREAEWFSSISIGDMQIDVLPFYGEQPVANPPRCGEEMRNWGNCYVIRSPEFSTLILVDSGRDADGNMIEVIREYIRKRGPVDVVLSCCADFPEAINAGLPHYALAVPFERLQEIYKRSQNGNTQSMTLGAKGIAEICKIAGARYFLPYAHGFAGLGRAPSSPEAGRSSETALVEQLAKQISRTSPSTTVVDWHPGDAFLLRHSSKFQIQKSNI